MTYSKDHPFLAAVKERYLLTQPGSQKETWHVVLDLKRSGICYSVGDCIGVVPVNTPDIVERTLNALQASGLESVVAPRATTSLPLREHLRTKANLTTLSKRLVKAFIERHPSEPKQQMLKELLTERQALSDYLEARELWDLLEEHPEVRFEPQELCNLLQPLLPRFYSIASSQRVVGDEVHLTVRHISYTSREVRRLGVCTHYLCQLAPLQEAIVPIFLQPTDSFRLPSKPEIPIIMVGPGTGVAPYRAFLQEREANEQSGANWLFFGEWTSRHDFFYKDYWNDLIATERLRLDTAFSRDQAHKIYVQHRLEERGAEVWEWLQRGAHFYVCGDAKQMAKAVDAALQTIATQYGQLDPADARLFVRQLRRDKRYLCDVY